MKLIVNGRDSELPDGSTLANLLASLRVSPERVAIEVNLDVIPRDAFPARRLLEGDRVEIVSFMAGG